jgi:hypothetical protein
MFLRRYQRAKDGKTHVYFALVESVRTQRGPRQRIVAQLGELSQDQQQRWQQTALFHTRERDTRQLHLFDDPSAPLEGDVVRVRLGKVGWSNARAFGDVWLGLQLWQMLGLDRIVERHLPGGRETVPPASMVAIEVISRLCIGQGGATSSRIRPRFSRPSAASPSVGQRPGGSSASVQPLRCTDLMTRIRKPDQRCGKSSPQDRPLSVALALSSGWILIAKCATKAKAACALTG